MTAHHDLDRQLNDFLRDGPEELPYQSFDAVRDRTESTRQRVVVGPWRLPEMNKIVTFGLGAAAVVVLLVVGAQFFGSSPGGFGNAPSPSPEASLAEPTATPEPPATPPPLTQSFTSTMHGISLSYPEGWAAQPATEPWTASTFPLNVERPEVDVLYDPEQGIGTVFLIFASQAIGDSTPDDWVAEQMASEEGCNGTLQPVSVDGGGEGFIGCTQAVVATDGRGYWIQLYTGDDAPPTYTLAWFEEVIATVQLHPEDAVD